MSDAIDSTIVQTQAPMSRDPIRGASRRGATRAWAGLDERRRAPRPRPQDLLLLLVFLAPYDGLLLVVPHPSWFVAWKEVLVGLIVVLAAFGHARKRTVIDWPVWLLPLLVLGGWALLSLAANPGMQSLFGVKVMFTFATLAVAMLTAPLDAWDRDRLVTILMVNGVVTAAVGVGQQLVGDETLNRIGYDYNDVIRFSGGFLRSFSTFNQPFPFAFFLMVVLLVGGAVSLENRQRLRNRIFLALAPLLIVAMVLTFVRAALLGSVIGLAILAVRRHRVLFHVMMPLPFVAAVVILSGLGAALLSPTSLIERIDGWSEQVVERSVQIDGEGIGSTGSVAERFAVDVETLDRPDSYQPDNYYVKTLVELGPLGAWLFLWVIIGSAVATHRVATGPNEDPGLAHGIAAATVAALAAALVASYWEIFPADLLFWVLVGVAPSLQRRSS